MKTFLARVSLAALVTGLITSAFVAPAQAEPNLDRIVSANPENFTPNVNQGQVNSLVQIGNRIIVGGKFTSVTAAASAGGATFTRNGVFAYNATTGVIDPSFVPNVGTKEVTEVVDAGDGTIFIGGLFANVNGAAKTGNVARINATTGAVVTTFKSPKFNAGIADMQYINNKLYVGGSFTTVAGQPRTLLAALNPTTGADTGTLDLKITDTWNGGTLGLKHFDISDDGASLVAIGNWRTVNGQSRPQIFKADLAGANATLSDWATQRFTSNCASVFDTYLRDIDIAPNGQYFVVAATGAYSGGANSGTLCDSFSRFELNPSTAGQDPTWIDYSGGDTVTQIKVTGDVIYVGGHFRWVNNPYASDAVGPGAVERTGLAAVDPRNGLPTTWNPTRDRGVGVWDFMTTSAGLWVGHDTNRTGTEARKRIALFPITGGKVLPAENTGTLPNHVYSVGQPAGVASGHWVARVNAAGPTLLANDNGPDWSADTQSSPSAYHGTNTNYADWGNLAFTRGANLPASTPTGLFSTELWSPNDSPNMQWNFAAPAGHHLSVRLYFANGCSCTEQVGQRVVDVKVDDALVLDNYDIVADVGDQVGTMKEFNVTSDGNVDIDFSHAGADNPLINGIEIIDNDVAAPGPGANDTVINRDFNGSTVASSQTAANGGQTWSNARGAMMIDGTVYTGWSDGTLKARTYNGTTFGAATDVNLNGLTDFSNELSNMTGMFYDKSTARMYYSLSGQSKLYYRYFLPESRTVGAVRFDGPDSGNGINFAKASGMFIDNGKLYVGDSATGDLRKVDWTGGALSGSASVVSGPSTDSNDWRARGTFIFAS